MLNARGGIECDLTVARLAEDPYYIVTGTGFATHDFALDPRNIPEGLDARLLDVTSAFAVLPLMGPQARATCWQVTATTSRTPAFPFGTWREIRIAGAPVRALRVTYVGELGWELHVPVEFALRSTMRWWRPAGLRPRPRRLPRDRERCAWRRAIAPGAPTSAPTTRRSRPGSASP